VESGYRNLGAEANRHVNTAGIWQFIPDTGRRYGLRIDETVDERRDLMKSADAALRLLSDLHTRFDDWGLALAAYNVACKRVQSVMTTHDTRSPLQLNEAEALPTYAADVMAGASLLRSDALIE
jgi:membrane-bound lytic murein transglycosylase D